jgi:hypothetical protein
MSSRPTAAADMNETTVSPALRLLRAAGNGNELTSDEISSLIEKIVGPRIDTEHTDT